MESLGKFFDGLAALAWPAILFFILYRFKDELKGIFSTVKEIQVGNAKLSFGQAADQLNKDLADLRNEFNAFKAGLEQETPLFTTKASMTLGVDREAVPHTGPAKINNILWVDDNPNDNAFIVKDLEDSGINITAVTSTFDGVMQFGKRYYDLVISDMGRAEGMTVNYTAGIDLVRQIRQIDTQVPIVIYCSTKARLGNEKAALEAGANTVLSSPTKLMAFIRQLHA
jgi:CheY-like chemotaxis protein